MTNDRLKAIFNEDAERYQRARPGYPAALFEDLARIADLRPGSRVLEIACGTGQATVPLAERGYQIVAVELGDQMAAVARRVLAPFPNVLVVTAAFEGWPLPPEPFDLIVCATAFHWLDPAVRFVKCAQALRPGGVLATIATHHVAGGTEPFFAGAQECYERWDPATPPGLRLESPEEIPQDREDIAQSGLFEPPEFRRYVWGQPYTTASYIDLLLTYSGHRALPPADQRGLLGCISGLIDTRYGGQIVKQYMTELRLARPLRRSH
jgi:SAM-dependent methyltransferase